MQGDATVFCNCFEKGRLREPPPVGCRLAVADDGSLLCGSDDLFVQMAFANWLHDRACDHADGRLVQRSLGDLAEIRALLKEMPGRYSMVLLRVLNVSNNEETVIIPRDLPALRAEVIALGDIRCRDPDKERIIRTFESRMAELVDCAMLADKPIALE